MRYVEYGCRRRRIGGVLEVGSAPEMMPESRGYCQSHEVQRRSVLSLIPCLPCHIPRANQRSEAAGKQIHGSSTCHTYPSSPHLARHAHPGMHNLLQACPPNCAAAKHPSRACKVNRRPRSSKTQAHKIVHASRALVPKRLCTAAVCRGNHLLRL